MQRCISQWRPLSELQKRLIDEWHLANAFWRITELGIIVGSTVAKSDLDGFYCRSERTWCRCILKGMVPWLVTLCSASIAAKPSRPRPLWGRTLKRSTERSFRTSARCAARVWQELRTLRVTWPADITCRSCISARCVWRSTRIRTSWSFTCVRNTGELLYRAIQ